MKCHNLESYLADYLEGELDAAREAELLAHVEECPVCRAEFEAHRELDERLGRFFALEREKAEAVANPLPEEAAARRVTPVYARPWALAVAAILVAVIGFAGWWAYRHSVPTGDMPLATLAQAEGAVLLKDGDGYRAIAPGHVLLQNDKIKVGAKGYAAFGLPGGNTLEVRGGTQLRLADFPDRFEVQMDRGQVWAHLPERPEKRFVIQTAHLKAIATGTVYGVAEGIGRSEVQVAEGTVVIESNGAREEVEAGENFSSGDTTGEDRTDWLSWSRFSAQLVELLPALPDDTGTRPLRTVSTASASALTATSAAVDPVDYLSTDTWMFAEVADWGEIVREFTATDYSALLREPTVRDWWEAVGARKAFDELLSQREVKNFHEIVKLLDGPMAWGIRDDGEFVIIASLGPNESQVRFLIDNMFAPEPVETLDPVEAETRRLWEEAGIEPGEPTRESDRDKTIRIAGNCLVLSNHKRLLDETAARLDLAEPTGFRRSDFYRKMKSGVTQDRLILGTNFAWIARNLSKPDQAGNVNAPLLSGLDLIGLPGLDYLTVSPDFVGRGMNQAARLSFNEAGRYGALNWLAEPRPMRGLDFLSPDVHLFASGVVRSPYQMLMDYLQFLAGSSEVQAFSETLAFIARNQAFLESFGGEVTIGVDSPVLPIPNLKIAIETIDRTAFAIGLDQVVLEVQDDLERKGKLSVIEEETYRGRTVYRLVIDGIPFTPAWAYVDDYCVFGPGPAFVRNSIDVYDSGVSIGRDNRLLSLLPGDLDLNLSLLVYQDIARSIPEVVRNSIQAKLPDNEKELVPDLGFLAQYRAAGVAYAYARADCVDVYFNTPTGIDLNMGMAVPMVANWLMPRTSLGLVVQNVARAQVALEQMQVAVMAYAEAAGHWPDDLGDLLGPGYLQRIPEDPFAPLQGETLRLIPAPDGKGVILYSIGPDGTDDRAELEYNFVAQYDGPGDIVIRLP